MKYANDKCILGLVLSLSGWFTGVNAQEIADKSFVSNQEQVIRQEFFVSANLNEVWEAWTTEEGL